MKLTIRIFIILLAIAATGCTKNEFTIDFALPENVSLNVTASYYATGRHTGLQTEAVAPISHGKGLLKGMTRQPVLLYLTSGSAKQATVVYVERGSKIKATGNSNKMETWKFGGNKINEQWSEWRNTYAADIASGDSRKINNDVAKYVYANPSNPLSTLLLLTSFSRKDDEGLFRTLWFKLQGEARDAKWINLVSRADQPTVELIQPGKLISMVMRSATKGVDTIRTASANASLFFFWTGGLSERKNYIDSLKKLVREYPDSSSRIIADVFMDADSMMWRSPMRTDSLTKVNRLWAPAGMADRQLMMLEVRQSPFFIVFSKDGNQRYRGSDISDAFKEFRSLMK